MNQSMPSLPSEKNTEIMCLTLAHERQLLNFLESCIPVVKHSFNQKLNYKNSQLNKFY